MTRQEAVQKMLSELTKEDADKFLSSSELEQAKQIKIWSIRSIWKISSQISYLKNLISDAEMEIAALKEFAK